MGFMKSIKNAMGQSSGKPSQPSGGGKLFRGIRGAIGKLGKAAPAMMADGGYVTGKRVEKSYGKKK